MEDLATEEAVLGREVAFDVDEADNAGGVVVGEEKGSESAHGVAYEVELVDVEVRQDGLGGGDQEGDVGGGEVVALCVAASWRVEGQIAVFLEGWMHSNVGEVFFAGAEAVEEENWGFGGGGGGG